MSAEGIIVLVLGIVDTTAAPVLCIVGQQYSRCVAL